VTAISTAEHLYGLLMIVGFPTKLFVVNFQSHRRPVFEHVFKIVRCIACMQPVLITYVRLDNAVSGSTVITCCRLTGYCSCVRVTSRNTHVCVLINSVDENSDN